MTITHPLDAGERAAIGARGAQAVGQYTASGSGLATHPVPGERIDTCALPLCGSAPVGGFQGRLLTLACQTLLV